MMIRKIGFRSTSAFAVAVCLAFFVAAATPTACRGQIPAFSGAEGYGGTFSGSAPAAGWFSNATVYHVTNLNDNGPGSLRDAFVQNSSNKVIVFDVAGTIHLTSGKLDIKNLANYYIAGQTAPGPVTVYGDMVQLTHSPGKENRNVVLRYLSFRKGLSNNDDSITFAGGGLGTNLIIDHVSASWSEDEILSVTNNNTDISVQYSMLHDALNGDHAFGSLLRPRISSSVTFHHNLYANNVSRQARFGTYYGETLTADFRNNVVYNWQKRASYAGGSSEDDREYADINYVGNYLVAGPGTTSNSSVAFVVDGNIDATIYQSGNYIDPDDAPGGAPADGVVDGSDTGWSMFQVSSDGDGVLIQQASPFATPAVTTQTAPAAYQQVVDYVGNWWWSRDVIDSRVIGNVTNFTGVPIGADAPIASELSALLAAPMVSHPGGYDSDNDGMADAWEAAHGGDLVWNQDFDNDGYINLMEFVNELGEFPAPTPLVFQSGGTSRYAEIQNWRTDDGGVTTGTMWQPSKFDMAVIESGAVVVDAVGQHAGMLLVGGGPGDAPSLSVSSGWLRVEQELVVGSTTGPALLSLSPTGSLVSPQVTINELGALQGSGVIDGSLTNAGQIAPGNSAGVIEVTGGFAQIPGGELVMQIESLASFDRLIVGGHLSAAGTLRVELDGYAPQSGDVFDLLDFSSASGAFALDLPSLDAGLAWNADNLFTSGELSVVSGAAFENADFNDDGIVDGADFLTWQRGYNAAGDLSTGDANADDFVDGADLAIFAQQFGSTAAEATAAAVPEPGAMLLLLAGVACTAGAAIQRPA
ncbi:MAG: hypothetical protein KDA44_16540 [Planctomycetales bacterium]|nr:hypothetical protein [Planctomycetales bacterium]